MRTTVTLDPDTEQVVRERMDAEGVSFKRALNDAIRDGAQGRPSAPRFHTPSYSMGEPYVDLTKALQLAGELEDEAILEKMRLGK